MNHPNVIDFDRLSMADVAIVGGKNAALGELFKSLRPLGVSTVDGFAVTADAYRLLLAENGLADALSDILYNLDANNIQNLSEVGEYARTAVMSTPLPAQLVDDIESAYHRLCERCGGAGPLAVRSSATAEDLPGASFAGQHQTVLNVEGKEALVTAVHQCFASLFTDRAIDYRVRNGFDHMSVALSVGVQPMIRSDLGSAGVIFTLDTETGFKDVVEITGSYGVGESVVQGSVNPDEWTVFKPTLNAGFEPIISRRLGSKEHKFVFGKTGLDRQEVGPEDRRQFCLTDSDVLQLAKWACLIEDHYSSLAGHRQPMDIEWAKDGRTGQISILQARPETVHTGSTTAAQGTYVFTQKPPEPLVTGQAIGERIATGPVRIILEAKDLNEVQPGDVLVARSTDPDWEPIMKRVAAIVTDQGGRTSHAAIVSREVGVPCVAGTLNGTTALRDGDIVTVSCAEGNQGYVYPGRIPFLLQDREPQEEVHTKTQVMVNVGDPEKAFSVANLPTDGVGLARIEFIVTSTIGIHPMVLVRYPALSDPDAVAKIAERLNGMDPKEFFVQRMSEGIATIAAAFYPKPVIVRTSDFKTNEYAKLTGGQEFEPVEENPMLGFRGASRYYDPRYEEAFALECLALSRVRKEMGLMNVKVMIPFCRTAAEATKVVETMASHGLRQGEAGLEIYAMCEIPSNALNAAEFLKIFDGYSIGSNDLTQLTLGIDRDAGAISHLFDERDPSVKTLIAMAISAAKELGKPIGICGQAPSDYPEFAAWLVQQGITSISLNPDSVLKTIGVIAQAEAMNDDIALTRTLLATRG